MAAERRGRSPTLHSAQVEKSRSQAERRPCRLLPGRCLVPLSRSVQFVTLQRLLSPSQSKSPFLLLCRLRLGNPWFPDRPRSFLECLSRLLRHHVFGYIPTRV